MGEAKNSFICLIKNLLDYGQLITVTKKTL